MQDYTLECFREIWKAGKFIGYSSYKAIKIKASNPREAMRRVKRKGLLVNKVLDEEGEILYKTIWDESGFPTAGVFTR